MCGIAGIVGKMSEEPTAQRPCTGGWPVQCGTASPDSTGIFESSADARNRGCMLAHRRLPRILDLSTAADQPMTRPALRPDHLSSSTGEIYNYRGTAQWRKCSAKERNSNPVATPPSCCAARRLCAVTQPSQKYRAACSRSRCGMRRRAE